MISSAVTVILGLSVLFIVLGTLASSGLRMWQRNTDAHSRELYCTIGRVLDSTSEPGPESLTAKLYESDTIKALAAPLPSERWRLDRSLRKRAADPGRSGPDYIPKELFTDSVSNLLCGLPDPPKRSSYEQFSLLERLGDKDDGPRKLDAIFDVSMRAATDRFKIRTRWRLFGLGLLIAIFGNINAIDVAQALWEDESRRDVIAEQIADCEPVHDGCLDDMDDLRAVTRLPLGPVCETTSTEMTSTEMTSTEMTSTETAQGDSAPMPGREPCSPWRAFGEAFPGAVPGWFVTALGVSLGGPAWFDIARRFVGLRST